MGEQNLEVRDYGLLECPLAPDFRHTISVAMSRFWRTLRSTLRICLGRFLDGIATADAPIKTPFTSVNRVMKRAEATFTSTTLVVVKVWEADARSATHILFGV